MRFLWRPTMTKPAQINEYQRNVFGVKTLPTCANYALKRLATDNEEEFPIAAQQTKTTSTWTISSSQSKHQKKQKMFSSNCNHFSLAESCE